LFCLISDETMFYENNTSGVTVKKPHSVQGQFASNLTGVLSSYTSRLKRQPLKNPFERHAVGLSAAGGSVRRLDDLLSEQPSTSSDAYAPERGSLNPPTRKRKRKPKGGACKLQGLKNAGVGKKPVGRKKGGKGGVKGGRGKAKGGKGKSKGGKGKSKGGRKTKKGVKKNTDFIF
jgi:hypothetical protein